jgi:uncharacterized protein (TIGR04255 family)
MHLVDSTDNRFKLKNPPLAEVAVVVQFDAIALKNQDLFRLWSETRLKDLYPEVTEYGELPPFFEVFGSKSKREFEAMPPSGILRLNFRNLEIDEQFQVQRNRAGFYWQRREANRKYPGHPYSIETFLRDFEILSGFFESRSLGRPKPNQCAMSYSNRLVKGREWADRNELRNVVTFLNDPRGISEGIVESVETVRRYQLAGPEGKPIARLYVALTDSDVTDELDLEFVLRGPPPSQDLGGVRAFFEWAHEEIRGVFKATVTPKMLELWGQE